MELSGIAWDCMELHGIAWNCMELHEGGLLMVSHGGLLLVSHGGLLLVSHGTSSGLPFTVVIHETHGLEYTQQAPEPALKGTGLENV